MQRLLAAFSLGLGVFFFTQVGAVAADTNLHIPAQLTACMAEAIGEDAFAEIASGARAPTSDERLAGQECVDEQGTTVVITTTVPTSSSASGPANLTSDLKKCLRDKIGAERFDAMIGGTGGQPSVEERAAMETCFGEHGKPTLAKSEPKPTATPGSGGGMPPAILNCLKAAIGETAFEAMMSGKRQPTADEQAKGQPCFEKYKNALQGNLTERHSTAAPMTDSGGIRPIVDAEKEACMKRLMGDQYDVVKLGASPPPVEKMQEISKTCFGQDLPAGAGQTARSASPPEQSPEIASCMTQAFGTDLAEKMRTGNYTATDSDQVLLGKEKMSACLDKAYEGKSRQYSPSPAAAYDLGKCAQIVLDENYDEYRAGTHQLSDAESTKIKSCSSDNANIGDNTSPGKHPKDACFERILGDKFAGFQQGKYQPTDEDRRKVNECMGLNTQGSPMPSTSADAYPSTGETNARKYPTPSMSGDYSSSYPSTYPTDPSKVAPPMMSPNPTDSPLMSPDKVSCHKAIFGSNFDAWIGHNYTPSPEENQKLAAC